MGLRHAATLSPIPSLGQYLQNRSDLDQLVGTFLTTGTGASQRQYGSATEARHRLSPAAAGPCPELSPPKWGDAWSGLPVGGTILA